MEEYGLESVLIYTFKNNIRQVPYKHGYGLSLYALHSTRRYGEIRSDNGQGKGVGAYGFTLGLGFGQGGQ